LTAFSFATSNFSRQRVEARQQNALNLSSQSSTSRSRPDCTAQTARKDRHRIDRKLQSKAGSIRAPRSKQWASPDLDIYRAVRPGILDGIVICAGGE